MLNNLRALAFDLHTVKYVLEIVPDVSHFPPWHFILLPDEDEGYFGNAHLNSQRSQTLQKRISGQRHVLDQFRVGSDVVLREESKTGQDFDILFVMGVKRDHRDLLLLKNNKTSVLCDASSQ